MEKADPAGNEAAGKRRLREILILNRLTFMTMDILAYSLFGLVIVYDLGLAILFAVAIRAYQTDSGKLRRATNRLIGLLVCISVLSLFGGGFASLLITGLAAWASIRISQNRHPRFRYEERAAERAKQLTA